MPSQHPQPVISLHDLPDYDRPVALHGARLDSGPALGVNDDLWVIAIILVHDHVDC